MARTADEFLHLRISAQEKRLLEQAAERAGMSVAQYIKLVMSTLSTGVLRSSDDEISRSLDMIGSLMRARLYSESGLVEPEPDDEDTTT